MAFERSGGPITVAVPALSLSILPSVSVPIERSGGPITIRDHPILVF